MLFPKMSMCCVVEIPGISMLINELRQIFFCNSTCREWIVSHCDLRWNVQVNSHRNVMRLSINDLNYHPKHKISKDKEWHKKKLNKNKFLRGFPLLKTAIGVAALWLNFACSENTFDIFLHTQLIKVSRWAWNWGLRNSIIERNEFCISKRTRPRTVWMGGGEIVPPSLSVDLAD